MYQLFLNLANEATKPTEPHRHLVYLSYNHDVMTNHSTAVNTITWDSKGLLLLDQRYLPERVDYLRITTVHQAAKAIQDMVVRGAPAIGITGAYATVLAARHCFSTPIPEDPLPERQGEEREKFADALKLLKVSRPTAVNLQWAIKRMQELADKISDNSKIPDALEILAKEIHAEDIEANYRMGELGAALIEQPCSIITHCNAGALATGGIGTALGVVRAGFRAGKIKRVFADETRPWFQGARLTAWELLREGIPVSLIADGAAGHALREQVIAWAIVGADRIVANGDVANKIGTYSLAINARYHGVKFMVVAPSSTIDMTLATGEDVPIEERDNDELFHAGGRRIAPEGLEGWNPVFDITPAALVDVLVTERGIVESPNREKMRELMA